MSRPSRFLIILAVVGSMAIAGCHKEQSAGEDAFKFVTYPGSRYLPQLTELTKQAHKFIRPGEQPPATMIYDTDASVDEVATFYARAYGYPGVAPDATNDLSAAKPSAYYRTGDLATDTKAIESLLPKLNLHTDISRAVGTYKAAEIAGKANRPRVTVQNPYFDATTSQVVPRTLILMAH